MASPTLNLFSTKIFYDIIVSMLKWMVQNIYSLNSSKFFSGIVMLMLNIGSKYITIELSKSQTQYLRTTLARQLLIFSISWMGTRDIFKALALTAIFNVLTQHLFNEESSYCIIPQRYRRFEEILDANADGKVSDREIKQAVQILEKARKREQKQNYLRSY